MLKFGSDDLRVISSIVLASIKEDLFEFPYTHAFCINWTFLGEKKTEINLLRNL